MQAKVVRNTVRKSLVPIFENKHCRAPSGLLPLSWKPTMPTWLVFLNKLKVMNRAASVDDNMTIVTERYKPCSCFRFECFWHQNHKLMNKITAMLRVKGFECDEEVQWTDVVTQPHKHLNGHVLQKQICGNLGDRSWLGQDFQHWTSGVVLSKRELGKCR